MICFIVFLDCFYTKKWLKTGIEIQIYIYIYIYIYICIYMYIYILIFIIMIYKIIIINNIPI